MNEKTMNMNLEEFTEYVAEEVKKKMPQLEIKTVQQEKNNGVSKLGICMGKIKEGERWSASPIVYLDDIYGKVQKMGQIEILVDKMINFYETEVKKDIDFSNISKFLDYEKAKPHLYPKLISTKENKELLSGVPHKNILDLSVVYYLRCDSGKVGAIATSVVRNEQLENWGVAVSYTHLDVYKRQEYDTIIVKKQSSKKL